MGLDRCRGLSNCALACSIWGFSNLTLTLALALSAGGLFNMGVQQSLDLASSPRSIKLQMSCSRRYIEYTPNWLKSVVCMCATTGVRRFRGCRLYSTGGRILRMQSSYNTTVAAEILTETAFICAFQTLSLLETNTRGVLRLYTQQESIVHNSVPTVTA